RNVRKWAKTNKFSN
ncbi:Formamidopyrimidine-DNA glycosylase, partial [Haemophilus influenzae]